MKAAFSIMLYLHAQYAPEPDAITRQIGLEILKHRMIEHRAQQIRSINWTPPGYFLIGYTVRVG